MKLLHFTRQEYCKNICDTGMNLKQKKRQYLGKEYIDIDYMIDTWGGKTRVGKEHLNRCDAHYFTFESEKWCKCNNNVDACIVVDISGLDRSKAFVSSMIIPEMLYEEVRRNGQNQKVDLLLNHYWNDFFTLDFYIENRRYINNIYRKYWNHPFVPEVLYFGDIPTDKLDVLNIDNYRNNEFCKNHIPYSAIYLEKRNLIMSEYFFSPDGLHGVYHAKRVLYISLILADSINLTDEEKEIISLAAIFHDIGRINDFKDNNHGKRSWNKLQGLDIWKKLKDGLNLMQIDTIEKLICFHCLEKNHFSDERAKLYKCLKDADCLDRIRFNGLNTAYLQLETSLVFETVVRRLYEASIHKIL